VIFLWFYTLLHAEHQASLPQALTVLAGVPLRRSGTYPTTGVTTPHGRIQSPNKSITPTTPVLS